MSKQTLSSNDFNTLRWGICTESRKYIFCGTRNIPLKHLTKMDCLSSLILNGNFLLPKDATEFVPISVYPYPQSTPNRTHTTIHSRFLYLTYTITIYPSTKTFCIINLNYDNKQTNLILSCSQILINYLRGNLK